MHKSIIFKCDKKYIFQNMFYSKTVRKSES